jgi:hypothetical protein
MKEFNRTTLKEIRADMDAALALVAEQHGLEIQIGNMRFSSSEVTIKVVAKVEGAVNELLVSQAERHNLTLEERDGKKLVNFNRKAAKYPWEYTESGKTYKCNVSSARAYFGDPTAPTGHMTFGQSLASQL